MFFQIHFNIFHINFPVNWFRRLPRVLSSHHAAKVSLEGLLKTPLVIPVLGLGTRCNMLTEVLQEETKFHMAPRCLQPLDKPLKDPPGSRQLQTPHRHQLTQSCHNRHQRSRRSSSGSGVCRAGWSWAPGRWGQIGRGGHSQAPGLCCHRPYRPGTLPLWGREEQGTRSQSVDMPLVGCPGAGWGEGMCPWETEIVYLPSETINGATQGSQYTLHEKGRGARVPVARGLPVTEFIDSSKRLHEPQKKRWAKSTINGARAQWPCVSWKRIHTEALQSTLEETDLLHGWFVDELLFFKTDFLKIAFM